MSIKERINTIKAKKAQIEALLSAKEKEVEEEYQMVMELYNEVNERVEAIKTKQKTTEETLDKYDGLLAFLNDGAVVEETTEEVVEKATTEEPTINEPVKLEEPKKSDSDSSVVKQKWNIDTSKKEPNKEEPKKEETKEEPSKEEIDKIFAAAGFGEEVKEEVKEPVKQEYVDETLTQEDRDKANPDEIDALLNMI